MSLVLTDDHLQKAVPLDDYLQEASPSGRPIRMVHNNNNRGDGEGVTRVTGVTRGDGIEAGEEGGGEIFAGGHTDGRTNQR